MSYNLLIKSDIEMKELKRIDITNSSQISNSNQQNLESKSPFTENNIPVHHLERLSTCKQNINNKTLGRNHVHK